MDETLKTSNDSSSAPVYTYAGFWLRFFATIIDSIIIYIILFIPYTILFSIIALIPRRIVSTEENLYVTLPLIFGVAIIAFFTFALTILYYTFMESSKYQATLGKRVLGLIVTDEAGNRLSFERALLRNLGKILSRLIFDIGFIMAAFTEKKQGLHDLLAKTLVLKKV